jgi:hypothetical protein
MNFVSRLCQRLPHVAFTGSVMLMMRAETRAGIRAMSIIVDGF